MADVVRNGVRLAPGFTLSLAPGASLDETEHERISVTVGVHRCSLGLKTTGMLAAVQRLTGDGAEIDELRQEVLAHDGAVALPALHLCLMELAAAGLLCHGIREGGQRLITAIPLSPRYRVRSTRLDPSVRYVLSRFVFLRRDGDSLVLESPRSFARIVVHDNRAAALLACYAVPSFSSSMHADSCGLSAESLARCADLLWRLLFLLPVDESGATDEDSGRPLGAWEFHDLLFHSRSRRGRHRYPYGATYRLKGQSSPLPAMKPRMRGSVTTLFRPDPAQIRASDEPFTTVLESRRSRRHHDGVPMPEHQLGEFLYRSCRVRQVIPEGARELYEATDRVYPSGGAAYPLEVYLIIRSCGGIAPGLYHYQGSDHDLTHVSDPTAHTDGLLRSAGFAAGTSPPQVLIVLAARIERIAWKYSSMAYSIVLKDVGVMFQTMYLVATAMGLAGCAVGGGNSDLFSLASGIDYYSETSVGEFMLGVPAVT